MYRVILTSKLLCDEIVYEAETEAEMSAKIKEFIKAQGTFFAGMYESRVDEFNPANNGG